MGNPHLNRSGAAPKESDTTSLASVSSNLRPPLQNDALPPACDSQRLRPGKLHRTAAEALTLLGSVHANVIGAVKLPKTSPAAALGCGVDATRSFYAAQSCRTCHNYCPYLFLSRQDIPSAARGHWPWREAGPQVGRLGQRYSCRWLICLLVLAIWHRAQKDKGEETMGM